MLGLKIITKCQFEMMNVHIEELTEENMSLRKQLEKCNANAKELYDETVSLSRKAEKKKQEHSSRINKLIGKLKTKHENIKFDDLFRFVICDKKCSVCKEEQPDCKKYIVGDKTVCILRRQPSFPDTDK